MKKLLSFVFCFITFSAVSQLRVPMRVQLGFQLGMGPTTVFNQQPEVTGTRQGGDHFQIGMLIRQRLSRRFSVVLNPLYQTYNYRLSFDYEPFDGVFPDLTSLMYPYTVEAQTLALPVLARWDFGQRVTFFVQTGIQIDFEVQRMHTRDLRWTVDIPPPEDPYLGHVHRFEDVKEASIAEWSSVLGLGLFVPVGHQVNLSLETRATMKMSPTALPYNWAGDDYLAYPLHVSVLLGCVFDLGR